jgi:hypothetical protein
LYNSLDASLSGGLSENCLCILQPQLGQLCSFFSINLQSTDGQSTFKLQLLKVSKQLVEQRRWDSSKSLHKQYHYTIVRAVWQSSCEARSDCDDCKCAPLWELRPTFFNECSEGFGTLRSHKEVKRLERIMNTVWCRMA